MGDSTSLAGELIDIGTIVGVIALAGKIDMKGGKAALQKRTQNKSNKVMNLAQSKRLEKFNIFWILKAKQQLLDLNLKIRYKIQQILQWFDEIKRMKKCKSS